MRNLMVAVSAAAISLVLGYLQPADAAGLLSISGSSDQAVPANNDLIPTPNAFFQALVPLGGTITDADNSGLFWSAGAQLSTTTDNVKLSYNYIGSFAGAANTFSTPGGSFTTPGIAEGAGGDSTAQGSFDVLQALASIVGLTFSTDFGGGSSVDNSANNAVGSGKINFLMSYLEQVEDGRVANGVIWEITDTPTDVVLLLLDDSGAGPDSDYDDLGVVVVATPIPAALPLFFTALVSFVLMAGRGRSRG